MQTKRRLKSMSNGKPFRITGGSPIEQGSLPVPNGAIENPPPAIMSPLPPPLVPGPTPQGGIAQMRGPAIGYTPASATRKKPFKLLGGKE
jgi:hypothetical protein